MLKNKNIHIVVFPLFCLTFALGVVYLLILRFGQGDVYPAYSSLRSDPLGARALFDSLEELGGRDVQRNYEPLERMTIGKGATVLYLGATPVYVDTIHKDVAAAFDRITDSGGRLVDGIRMSSRDIICTTSYNLTQFYLSRYFFSQSGLISNRFHRVAACPFPFSVTAKMHGCNHKLQQAVDLCLTFGGELNHVYRDHRIMKIKK